jgi:acyl-CoA thioesterase
MPTSFAEETAVRPLAPSRFRAEFSNDWVGPAGPQGGVVSATVLRAMTAALGVSAPRLRTSTTVFASGVPEGDADIDVEVLRTGRSVTQVQGTVRGAGATSVGHRTLAVFGHERGGFEGTALDFTELVFPEVPPPEECRALPKVRPQPSIFDFSLWRNFDVRDVRFHYAWEREWAGGTALGLRWIRYRDAPIASGGDVDPLAYLPILDVIPGAVAQRLGPNPLGGRQFFAPTLDLTVHFLDTTNDPWMLQVMRRRRATHGYGSGEMELWSRDGRLLAHASQTMLLRVADGVLATEPG